MLAVSMALASRSFPLKCVLRGDSHFDLATVIDVAECLAVERPFKRLETRGGFAGLENHIEQGTVLKESKKCRVTIVSIELLEISPKRFAEQRVERLLMSMLAVKAIVCKHIARYDFGFQSKLDIETK